MFWCMLAHLALFLVDLLAARRPDRDKDLQILLLRHQVRLLQRQRPRPPRVLALYPSEATRTDKEPVHLVTLSISGLQERCLDGRQESPINPQLTGCGQFNNSARLTWHSPCTTLTVDP